MKKLKNYYYNMFIKISNADFIKKANYIHDNKYDYSSTEYIGSHQKIKIICPEHGEFEQRANSHLSGYGCKKCSFDSISSNTEEFIKKAEKTHNYKYDYSLVNYTKSRYNINIICKKHGVFKQKVETHLSGKGCPKCAGRNKSLEEFINELNITHKYKYDYSLVKHINHSIKIICPEHGMFEQLSSHHKNGHGCSKCSGTEKSNSEDFIEKAKIVHSDKYDYSLVEYKNNKTNIKIICSEHGLFNQSPSAHLLGCGCPICKESKGEKNIKKILKNNNINFIREYKFEECKNILPLPFDFYLSDYNMCIEYDGRQHFDIIEIWGGELEYEKIVFRDSIKTEYCLKNNIKLLRIPYTINKIKDIENIIITEINS